MRDLMARFAFWRSARLLKRSEAWRKLAARLLGISDSEIEAASQDEESGA